MRTHSLLVIALALGSWTAVFYFLHDEPSPNLIPRHSIRGLLGGDASGFEQVLAPRPFEFPRDHGPHRTFRSEWWYLTGNLDDEEGRHFGFQLTFFRFGLSDVIAERESAWKTQDVYMGHFALTDVGAREMTSFERINRGVLGTAGARVSPFQVWIDDWRIHSNGDALFPLSLQAGQAGISLSLNLEQGKPIVLQGERGMSQKSAEPGNASYYYSYTRLPVHGLLSLGEDSVRTVSGQAWMDREWSTSALGEHQVGWDWFSIQLDDDTELMFYRLRQKNGSGDPHSAGTFVDANGQSQRLASTDVELTPLDYWSAPDGVRYPIRWQLNIPSKALSMEVSAYVLDQEINHSVRYWEGAVSAHGVHAGRPVAGNGYLEMTGYADLRTLE